MVGKGALAPCPPSIGSLILNGGHAFRPRSSSYGGRFCPPYALQMKATQSSNRAFPAAYGLPGGVLALRFVRTKELQPLLGVLVAGRCGGAKRHRYWRRIWIVSLRDLSIYRKKRDFEKTSEPSGEAKIAPSKRRRFVIQKHAATRLHYDLRLEFEIGRAHV